MKIEQKIPEGWSVKKLGDICIKIGDGIHTTPQYTDNSDFYFINGNNIQNGKIAITQDTKNITETEYLKYKQELSLNTLLMSINGTIGSLAFYKDEKVLLGKSAAYLNFTNQRIQTFIYFYLQTNLVKVKLYSELTGSTIKNLSLASLRALKILLPPLPEQEKIAGILSCWDDGIEKLSALIEKKKIQKKALMQQLLSGKHRLKGFSSPWHEVKLRDVLYEHKETSKGDETICSVSVHKGIISQIEHLGRSFAASNTNNYNLVHYGDVVYTKSPTGEFPYGIFKQSQQRTSVIVSPLYGVFTPKTYYLGYILDVFFSYAINLNNYLKPIIQKGAKNTINITNETFLSKAIFLPEETTEIQKLAEIFIKADEEIELLNKKLDAFKQEKKALMQQLLSGKIRVKMN